MSSGAFVALYDAIRNVEARLRRVETAEQQLPAWAAATLENSWVNVGAPYANVGYWKDPNGSVFLRGRLSTGTGVAFTLPAHYRPEAQIVFTVTGGTVTIATTGAVTPSGANLQLEGIVFRAFS